jgi:hypothetical protein
MGSSSPHHRNPAPASSPLFVLCVFSIAVALHGVTNVVTSLGKPADLPDASMWNAHFCRWRMHETCWASPNVTLSSYELLFPVTREALFQRGITDRFQPLETRYDVAVVWNAMARCREIHQRLGISPLDPERVIMFESLPTNVSVDAWCGASLLARAEKEEEPKTAVWLFPEDAMVSPFTAHHALFLEETAARDHHERMRTLIEGLSALAVSFALFLGRAQLVACLNWLRSQASRGKARSLVVNTRPADCSIAGPKNATVMNEDPVDPAWIDLHQAME